MKSDSMRITYAPPQSGTYDGLSYINSVLRPKQKPEPKHIGNTSPRPYAEVRASSSFSFLEAATLPEDLIGTAAEKDVSAMAIIDRNGVYGAPRFYTAAKKAGIKALVGSELIMDHGRITLLVESRTGYKNLCKLITAGAMKHPKGDARYTWELVEQYAEGLRCLTRDNEDTLQKIAGIFKGRTHVELQRHHIREEEHRNQMLIALARRHRLPLVATNGVRYGKPEEKELLDILTCIREGQHVDNAGKLLGINRHRHIKTAAEMCALFPDLPEAVSGAWELAHTLDFTLADLGYQFPDYPLPPGETNDSFLRKMTWNAAKVRFRPMTARAQRQIEKELDMIQKLELAGYFLIVWDIVRFCNREKILVQGRGSAANSAVCYALGITAVDPVKMDLLFERFLSEERGEWPDIDLDLPSGDQRERVIQHVYRRYGKLGAAMTANVITYRGRLAAREIGKAMGFDNETLGRLASVVGSWEYKSPQDTLQRQFADAGFDLRHPRLRKFVELAVAVQDLPRHLGQHSGGMVICQGQLDSVVPLEPASMPDRVVVQWDKEDCADMGIVKIDLLGLGMMAVLEESIALIDRHYGQKIDLAEIQQQN